MNNKIKKTSTEIESSLSYGLYIIATPIGNMGDITLRALETLKTVDIIICEDTRVSGKLLSFYGINTKKLPYHEHNAKEMRPKIISMLKENKSIALISDAGMPLISDPGYKLVQDCIAEDLPVTCLPGPCASITAIAVSGLPIDKFMFAGFLPQKSSARKTFLREFKPITATLIFYETAPRLINSLIDIKEVLGERYVAIARELTKKFEEVKREKVSALIEYYSENGKPKGEIAIVISGAEKYDLCAFTDEDLDKELTKMIVNEGMSVKDASAMAAKKLDCKKHYAYQRALALKDKE